MGHGWTLGEERRYLLQDRFLLHPNELEEAFRASNEDVSKLSPFEGFMGTETLEQIQKSPEELNISVNGIPQEGL